MSFAAYCRESNNDLFSVVTFLNRYYGAVNTHQDGCYQAIKSAAGSSCHVFGIEPSDLPHYVHTPDLYPESVRRLAFKKVKGFMRLSKRERNLWLSVMVMLGGFNGNDPVRCFVYVADPDDWLLKAMLSVCKLLEIPAVALDSARGQKMLAEVARRAAA